VSDVPRRLVGGWDCFLCYHCFLSVGFENGCHYVPGPIGRFLSLIMGVDQRGGI
jgi:hypothetical protein